MKLTLHCFGAATTSGEALRRLCECDAFGYSRSSSSCSDWLYPADLTDPSSFQFASSLDSHSILVSFAPIWLFAPFLESLASQDPDHLCRLGGVIACSSSSSITKRFASNSFDRNLVARLTVSEDQLLSTCRKLGVPCRILRPSLIYGRVGPFCDSNLSKLLMLMRRSPFLFLPSETGLRQPIHASQLASIVLHIAQQLAFSNSDVSTQECIAIGGDTTLTYHEMILALQEAQDPSDSARRCRLFLLPNRLFFLLLSPVMIRSPKSFEAIFRMGANLSGFIPAHQLLGAGSQPFPLKPLC